MWLLFSISGVSLSDQDFGDSDFQGSWCGAAKLASHWLLFLSLIDLYLSFVIVGLVLIVKTWDKCLFNGLKPALKHVSLADMSSVLMLCVSDMALQEMLLGRDATDIYRLITDQIETVGHKH